MQRKDIKCKTRKAEEKRKDEVVKNETNETEKKVGAFKNTRWGKTEKEEKERKYRRKKIRKLKNKNRKMNKRFEKRS